MSMAVPCLDLAWLPPPGESEPAQAEELASALDAAFGPEGLGLVCVTGDEDFQVLIRRLRLELLPLAQDLARLPEESKDAIREKGTLNVNNYSRGVDGNRTGFYFHPALDNPADCLPPDVTSEPTFYTPNLWPDKDLPQLRSLARQCAPRLVELGRLLAAAVDWRCSQVLPGYRPGTLRELIAPAEKCNHKCRLICYHDFDTPEQCAASKGMWAPPHKDTGLLTVLVPGIFLDSSGKQMACPDPEVGLYVRNRKGKTIQIQKPDGVGECLFFQVGEALQIVSGGLYHATEHCVRGPPSHGRGYERATLAVFLQPHSHEELRLPDGVSMKEVADRACDPLFRMFLLYQPKDVRGMNFLHFCQREGPKLSDAVAEAMARVSTPIYSDGLQKQYFSHLLEDVQRRRDQFPERRLYITGHSLGGGLAKLVAAKVGIPAVTFMAPGLESTSYLVFRQNMIQDLHNVALTVMPDNDVVSRVDIQSGITIKTECEGNMLHCHLLYPTICNFLDRCGSGRPPAESLYLPCGACEDMPCG
ncbi:unnamed protein product [Durusdinium trenchii]|uniref:Uncharacterized protein n=1 Tax=Durusdinium trenchii TaxID=1381693 RepID=A0ABP0QLF4_9DINO